MADALIVTFVAVVVPAVVTVGALTFGWWAAGKMLESQDGDG